MVGDIQKSLITGPAMAFVLHLKLMWEQMATEDMFAALRAKNFDNQNNLIIKCWHRQVFVEKDKPAWHRCDANLFPIVLADDEPNL